MRPHAATAAGSASYTYDAAGNMLTGAGRTLAYDGDSRLASVTTAASTTAYAYGPDGKRVTTVMTPVSGPMETRYLLGSTEIDNAGVVTKIPHADVRIVGSTSCFVHRDHLATVRLETDAAGAVGLRQRFQPYGERVPQSSGACAPESRGFIGQRHDDGTGLIDLNARWYDPALARFVTPDDWDPINVEAATKGEAAGWLASAVGTNRYAYSGDDPLNKSDVNGHSWSNPILSVSEWIDRGVTGGGVAGGGSGGWSFTTKGGMGASILSDRGKGSGSGKGSDGNDSIKISKALPQSFYIICAGPCDGIDLNGSLPGLGPGGGNRGNARPEGSTVKDIKVPRSKFPEATRHIEDAIGQGQPSVLTIDRNGAAARRQEATGGLKAPAGKHMDEYPPAMFKEGGQGASVRPINPSDNMGAGACIGNQCRSLEDGSRVRILIGD